MRKNVKIKDEYITLGQFLKFADIISSGGETRYFLENEKITVNGDAENRRGKKLYRGDEIAIKGIIYKIC